MTEKQLTYLATGLKEAGKAQFAQPQQAACLKAVMLANGIDAAKATNVLNEGGIFLNASAMLQTLKKMGIISSELSANQKAQAEALAKALKA
jgi:hypothetical protein